MKKTLALCLMTILFAAHAGASCADATQKQWVLDMAKQRFLEDQQVQRKIAEMGGTPGEVRATLLREFGAPGRVYEVLVTQELWKGDRNPPPGTYSEISMESVAAMVRVNRSEGNPSRTWTEMLKVMSAFDIQVCR